MWHEVVNVLWDKIIVISGFVVGAWFDAEMQLSAAITILVFLLQSIEW